MTDVSDLNKIYSLPAFEKLSPYWQEYFSQIDAAIQENFWGALGMLKYAEQCHDIYIQQQKEMGYCYRYGAEAPASFYQAMTWVFNNLHHFIKQGTLKPSDILWPARVFEITHDNGSTDYVCRVIGEEPPKHAVEVNLLTPDVFVPILAQGYFPLGSSIREHTNQTLAEHDLAHYGGFISCPTYMATIRQAFVTVCKKMKTNPLLSHALKYFNSIYSLRLYYLMEIFTIIPEAKKETLQQVLGIDLAQPLNRDAIIQILEEKAKNPAHLHQYLHRIYEQFNDLVDPLGGESRDILNRIRKFNRNSRLGNYYGDDLESKFDGSSIYSLYLNGCAALENKRSNHNDFLTSLREIHAPFIGALIGTSQLTVEDWVLQAIEEAPNIKSKLYEYLCKSGLWNDTHLIYLAHDCVDYFRILQKNTNS